MSAPERLPTHFIVYPDWMACDAVLGRPLHEATVLDSTILGGQTMRVYEADYSLLGSGENPWTSGLAVFDTHDVADLESEAAHRYELLGASDGEEIVLASPGPGGDLVADGGRTNRTRERFVVDAPKDRPWTLTVRLTETTRTRIHVLADDAEEGAFDVPSAAEDSSWSEYSVPVARGGGHTVELRAEAGTMTVFHYWFSKG